MCPISTRCRLFFNDMNVHERDIVFIKYSTQENWMKDLPKSNWLCILIDNDRPRNYLDEVISKIINNNVCYICTFGESCEKTHDLIDNEIAYRETDIDKPYMPDHFIMTTWHEDFHEGIFYAFDVSFHEQVNIDTIAILDMTDGRGIQRIKEILNGTKASN